MRRAFFILTLTTVILSAASARALGLYEASVIVTGTDARSRPAGLAAALAQVLAKVSGNPALLDNKQVETLAPAAPGLVEALAYLDRMSDIPKHDEQGTRDRPFDLVVRFNRPMLDAMLEGLGETAWHSRPPLAIAMRVVPRSGPPFMVHADTVDDERHRAALLAAAELAGLQVALPLETVDPKTRMPSPSLALTGTLTWQEGSGWAGQFSLPWRGRDRAWSISGAGFDEAYRAALRGAARILSGHDGE